MYDENYQIKMVKDTFNFDFDQAHLSKVVLPEIEAQQIQNWHKKPSDILFFAGNPGLGKTFLCVAFCKYFIETKKYFRCFTEKGFLSHLRNKIKEDCDPEFEIKRICETEYFVLDDVASAENMTDWQKEQLFSFLDHRAASRLPTIITSNLFMNDMKHLFTPRFISRLRDRRNTIIELNWIDKRYEDF